jgi:uncharacterized membrane protein
LSRVPPGPIEGQLVPDARTLSGDLRIVWQYFEGPLPPPAALEAYERAVPGLAREIADMAKSRHELVVRQSDHRQRIEERVIRTKTRNEGIGQWMAFIIAFGTIASGTGLAWNGKETAGIVAIVGALVALAGVFLLGRRRQATELSEKKAKGPK